MLTICSLTLMPRWPTSWRASARVAAKPMRYTTLSSRASSMRSRFSRLAPLRRAARGYFELALALERLQPALQEQVRAFAARKLTSGASVSRHVFFRLNPPLLRRTTAVVRDRGDVFDLGD